MCLSDLFLYVSKSKMPKVFVGSKEEEYLQLTLSPPNYMQCCISVISFLVFQKRMNTFKDNIPAI